MRSRHIQVRASAEGVDVIVDDREVLDYVDDFLTNCDLVFEFTRNEKHNGQR